jgi:hypothetical protein
MLPEHRVRHFLEICKALEITNNSPLFWQKRFPKKLQSDIDITQN